MTDISSEKIRLRRLIKERRSHLSAETLAEQSACIVRRLSAHPRFVTAQTVLLFCSLPDEPSLWPLLETLPNEKRILLPIVEGEDMYVKEFRGMADLARGAFRIPEPSGPRFAAYSAINLVVVPGVAFDRAGRRLGRGRGYYDRFLAQPELSRAYKIGLCFPFQIVDAVPAEPWDMTMDEILSCG